MSDTGQTTQAAPPPASPPPTQPGQSVGRRSLSCLGRLISALLVIILTTAVALAAGGALASYFGYAPTTPGAVQGAQQQVATLEAENSTLRDQAIEMQTQLAQLSRQSGSDREELDALKEQVNSFAPLGDAVATRLTADARERATLVTEIRASRDAVFAFATAEAGRAGVITELERRSARIERFLQRLSDISEDTVLDLGGATPTPAALSPTPPASTALPTVVVPSPTPSPAPVTPEATGAVPPSATVAASPSPVATPRATARPTAAPTITPSPRP